jgi:hypothetical protein
MAVESPPCDEDVKVIYRPANAMYPSAESVRDVLPGTSYLHAGVEGAVTLRLVVTESGDVMSASIVESTAWSPRFQKHFDNFFDDVAMKHALAMRYSRPRTGCIKTFKMTWQNADPDPGVMVEVPSPTYHCTISASNSCELPEAADDQDATAEK